MRRRREKTAVTAAHACRVPLFAPTRGCRREVTRSVSTAWGSATITGALDQRHHDALDAVLACADASYMHDTGDVTVRVDSAAVRRTLGRRRWDYAQIIDALRDLRRAEIALRIPGWGADWSGIIMRVRESDAPPPPRQGSRAVIAGSAAPDPQREWSDCRGGMIWEVTVSRAWIELVRRLRCVYPRDVWRLRHGVSQAVARMVLTHREPRLRIETALAVIGVDHHPARAVAALRDDAQALARVGVDVDLDAGYVSRRGHQAPEPGHQAPEPGHQAPEPGHQAPEPIDI